MSKPDFSIARLRAITETRHLTELLPTGPPKPKAGKRFLKGPIPLEWLILAGRQPGMALHVAIWLWYLAGLTRSRQVQLNGSQLAMQLHVNRRSVSRGLAALENAHLITVVRRSGKKRQVTLLDVEMSTVVNNSETYGPTLRENGE